MLYISFYKDQNISLYYYNNIKLKLVKRLIINYLLKNC
jgi:hypothetical protein